MHVESIKLLMLIKMTAEHIPNNFLVAKSAHEFLKLAAFNHVLFKFLKAALELAPLIRTLYLLIRTRLFMRKHLPVFVHIVAIGVIYAAQLDQIEHFPCVRPRLVHLELLALHRTGHVDLDPVVDAVLAEQRATNLTFVRLA